MNPANPHSAIRRFIVATSSWAICYADSCANGSEGVYPLDYCCKQPSHQPSRCSSHSTSDRSGTGPLWRGPNQAPSQPQL